MNTINTRSFAYALLLFCLTLIASSAIGQLNYLASTEDGSSYEVCLEGDYLYVGAANTLKVYSLNGPNQTPDSNTFSLRLKSNIDQILVRDGFLYVCANHDGLWKYDISQTPESPSAVAHYTPANLDESIYDVAFYGDSLVVAAKRKVLLLSDSAGAITYRATIATYTGTQRVHGVDIKGNLLAYTVGLSGIPNQDGVYLVQLTNLQQIGYYGDQSQCDAWEVYFGENDSVLHVMGGISFTFAGLYYVVDYTVPSSMQLLYDDVIYSTIGFGVPMNAEIIHDTLYISTQGGRSADSASCCYVYVYDATSPTNIQKIEDLTGGLYHFDIEINETTRTMYVASEWYGILTVDIQDLSNEVVRAKTLTGGWCHGSAFAVDRLVEANEGYGVRLFDMTVRQSPSLIQEDTAIGFCRAISMDDSAQYIYAWYLTNQRLRVYDARNLTLLADTGGSPVPFEFVLDDFSKSRIHGDYVAVIEDPTFSSKKIMVADISNPLQPFIRHVRNKPNVVDLQFLSSGNLVACADDSIIIFDPSTMQVLSAIVPPNIGNSFKAIALNDDTLFTVHMNNAFGTGEHLARYWINPSTFAFTMLDNTLYPLNSKDRIHLATQDSILYLASSIDQLKALANHPPYQVLATYDHSADHMVDNDWGVTDLYYSQGLLILNEYMGQSSIFGAPTVVAVDEPLTPEGTRIYPNPTHGGFALKLETPERGNVEVYDLNGRRCYATTAYSSGEMIPTEGWDAGMYFVVWEQGGRRWTGKLVKVE
jgi:hypothetical protein